MASPASENILSTLRGKQLLTKDQCDVLAADHDLIAAEPQRLVSSLVERKWLSPYQAELVLTDHIGQLAVGPYLILEPIGEGGMGQVYRARHTLLGRIVALKVIHQRYLADSPSAVTRFAREARAAGNMSHPNVVAVYDFGRCDEQYFMAMEHLEGMNLERMVELQGPLPVDVACDFVRQACLGLQHAHERGMVHRDIKPSNLFAAQPPAAGPPPPKQTLGAIGAAPAIPGRASASTKHTPIPPHKSPATSARPKTVIKILDLGLVRLTKAPYVASSAATLTEAGSPIGTPDYISPEQARHSHLVDIRADLYSLGCTFYYLVAGRPPFPHGNAVEKLLMHMMDQPTPLEKLRPDIDPAIAKLIGKLMAKAPVDRFQTPAEVAQVLSGTATTPAQQHGHSAAPTLTGLNRSAPPVRKPSDTPAPHAGAAPPKADHVAASVYRWAQGGAAPKAEIADEIAPASVIAVLEGKSACITSLAFSPNRDLLAAGSADGLVCIWDFSGPRPCQRALLRTKLASINSLAFAPNSQELAIGSGNLDGVIQLWRLSANESIKTASVVGHKGAVSALAFSPEGTALAVGSHDKTVTVWEVRAAELHRTATLRGHVGAVHAVAFAPDGRFLCSAGQDGTARLWSVGRVWSKELAIVQGHKGPVQSVAFAPDRKLLATASHDQTIRVCDLTGSSPVHLFSLGGHRSAVQLTSFGAGGKTVVGVGDSWQVLAWDSDSGVKVEEWSLTKSLMTSFAVTHDGRYLAAGTSNGSVSVFRLGAKRRERQYPAANETQS